ncbi:MAG: hypothetical protein ACYDCQ_03035 [Dehalococcoidia bacterium]
MIYISGMEGGSGDGAAAGRKAGWLARQRPIAAPPQRPVAARPAASTSRSAPEWAPPRPVIGADGRPLPPDGSSPPVRPQTGAIPAAAQAPTASPVAVSSAPPFDPHGRPVPPAGSAPAGQRPSAVKRGDAVAVAQPAKAAIVRTPGAPLPPGASPSAPPGHSYTVRPGPAPAGEFLFNVRCSCGGEQQAPVTLAALRAAARQGIPAAAVIAIATQDALDAMHRDA